MSFEEEYVTANPALLLAIRHAIFAGACRKAARDDPGSAQVWLTVAAANSRKSTAYLEQALAAEGGL